MFKNYLKIAYRNLLKHKTSSIINIVGLAIGMVVCLMIFHYVNYEKSYDKFNSKYDRIYRLRYERITETGDAVRFASCCPPAAANIRGQYPEVENIARLLNSKVGVSYKEKKFFEKRMFYIEPQLFQILDFNFLSGDPETGLNTPGNAFISETIAKKYFGDENPIGKTLSVDKETDYQVIGIFQDSPSNSHLKIDIMLPWKNLEIQYGPDYYEAWGHTGSYTYVLLKEGHSPTTLRDKLPNLILREVPWLAEYKMQMLLPLQPLAEIHLNSKFMQEYEVNGNRKVVNFLSIIGIFIILIAWVNYVNLSTSLSFTRAKEVSMRKVAGASKKQLIIQFFIEIVLLNILSLGLCIILIEIMLPLFNFITGTPAEFSIWAQNFTWIAILLMFFTGIFLSGSYPVLALSSFKPIAGLKGNFGNSAGTMKLRKILVIFQFMIAIILITSTLTIFKQISYMQNQDLGFDIDQTLVISSPRVRDDNFGEKLQSYKDELLADVNINKICHVTEVPGRQIYWDAGGIFRVGQNDDTGKNYQIVGVDYDFVDFFDLKFVTGRAFSEEFGTDKEALILNETAIKHMGFDSPESAIGKQVNYWGQIFTIIGVLKDFHQQSPKEEFEPHIYRFMPHGRSNRGQFAIKINVNNVKETIQHVKKKYEELFPGNSFEYFFLKEYFNQQYKSDMLLGNVFRFFTILGILITSLGIFGLSSYTVNQRKKEIGIRKVLGANVTGIVFLFIKDLFYLIGISFIISVPLLIYGLNTWLNNYAKHIVLSGFLFVYAFIIICGVIICTVSIQTIKSALANPVESLKYE